MVDLPELTTDATDAVRRQARTLIPWLPDPMTCPECDALCLAGTAYSRQEAAFYPGGEVPVWACPEGCGTWRRVEPWDE